MIIIIEQDGHAITYKITSFSSMTFGWGLSLRSAWISLKLLTCVILEHNNTLSWQAHLTSTCIPPLLSSFFLTFFPSKSILLAVLLFHLLAGVQFSIEETLTLQDFRERPLSHGPHHSVVFLKKEKESNWILPAIIVSRIKENSCILSLIGEFITMNGRKRYSRFLFTTRKTNQPLPCTMCHIHT